MIKGRHAAGDRGSGRRTSSYELAGSLASCGQRKRKQLKVEEGGDRSSTVMEEELDEQEYVMDMVVRGDAQIAAASWSDCAIRVYDLSRGLNAHDSLFSQLSGHSERITALALGSVPHELFSSGEDGLLGMWDLRTGHVEQRFAAQGGGGSVPFGAMDVGCDGQLVAGGTQLDEESSILFWDRRSQRVLGEYKECHLDDLSQLKFDGINKTRLSSGSMDGLVCYFDVAQPDEESALLSVINAQSAVSRIGYFGPRNECLFVLTHSETLGLYHADKAATMAEFTNIREKLAQEGAPADYLVDCCYAGSSNDAVQQQQHQSLVLVSGAHNGTLFFSDVTLAGIRTMCSVSNEFGHSGDVRCAALLDSSDGTVPKRVISGGEDGLLCDWRLDAEKSNNVRIKKKGAGVANRRTNPF